MSKKKKFDIPQGSLERLKQINSSLQELDKQKQQLVNLYNAIGITLMDAHGLNPAEWRLDIDSGTIVPIERERPKEEPEEAEVVSMSENGKSK